MIRSRYEAAMALSCVAGLFLCAASADAQIPFDTPFANCPDQPGAIAAGDVDGDGDVDTVVAVPSSDSVVIRTNAENGRLEAGDTIAVGTDPQDVLLHDLDGDGRVDLVVANAGSGNVAVLLGQPGGTFATANFYATGAGASALAIDDVTGDTLADILVVNTADQSVSMLRNLGNGAFAPASTTIVDNDPSGVAIGDLDGDGDRDLAISRTFPVEGSWGDLLVMLNTGSGTFVQDSTYVIGLTPVAPAIADINGDSRNDIVVVNRDGISMAVLLNEGSADFGDGTVDDNEYLLAGGGPRDLVLTDLDDDGDPDAVVGARDEVLVFTNGGGGLIWSGSYYADTETNSGGQVLTDLLSIAVADFTGDDMPDIVGSHDADGYGYVATHVNHGDAQFDATATYSVSDSQGLGGGPAAVAIADLNLDGAPDIVTANPETNDVTVAMNDGAGAFGIEVGVIPPVVRPGFATGSNPIDVAIAQLDGEGGPDVVTADLYAAGISLLRNNNFGSPGPAEATAAGLLPTSVDLADLDDDGDLDVIVGHLIGNEITILSNDGNAVFDVPIEVVAGSKPRATAAADLDGDGDLDLAVANEGDATVSILLNQGALSFTPGGTFDVEAPYDIVAGDWDDDGNIDLATSNQNGTIWSMSNVGNAAFLDAVPHVVREGASRLTTADIDGDGVPDIAVANGDHTMTVLLARNGTFVVQRHRTPTYESTDVALGDLDGDGDLDLATTDGYTDRVSVITNLLPEFESDDCAADIDGNRLVGFDDLVILLGTWGPCPSGDCPPDLDGSGQVGFDDLVLLLGTWGPCTGDPGGPGPGPGGGFGG